VKYFEQEATLAQSPQSTAIMSRFERVFEIVRFRAEPTNDPHVNEYIGIDGEWIIRIPRRDRNARRVMRRCRDDRERRKRISTSASRSWTFR